MANRLRIQELIRIFQELIRGFPDNHHLNGVAAQWVTNLQLMHCPLCGKPPDEAALRDEISRKEYELSHICGPCQDEVFGPR